MEENQKPAQRIRFGGSRWLDGAALATIFAALIAGIFAYTTSRDALNQGKDQHAKEMAAIQDQLDLTSENHSEQMALLQAELQQVESQSLYDRYADWVGKLAAAEVGSRVAAVVALEGLAIESPELWAERVYETLVLHVKVQTKTGQSDAIGVAAEDDLVRTEPVGLDVNTVFDVLSRSRQLFDEHVEKLGQDTARLRAEAEAIDDPAERQLRLEAVSTGAHLVSEQFQRANLRDLSLPQAELTDVFFGEANLSGASFSQGTLTDVYFGQTRISDVMFDEATLIDVDFRYANFTAYNYFRQASMTRVGFLSGRIRGTLHVGSDFESAIRWDEYSLQSLAEALEGEDSTGHIGFGNTEGVWVESSELLTRYQEGSG